MQVSTEVGVSAAWFYYNPDARTVTNILAAMYGTLVVGSLSYLIQEKKARSDIRFYKQTLQALKEMHDDLLVKSLLSVGESDLSIPPVNVFHEKKEKLENLFKEPRYKGPKKESDRYAEILNLCHSSFDHLDKIMAGYDQIDGINTILKTKDTFLIQIISDATVTKNIELNAEITQ